MSRNEKLKSRLRASVRRRKERGSRDERAPQSTATVATEPDVAGMMVAACLEYDRVQGTLRDQEILAALRGLMRNRQPQAGRGADLFELLKETGEKEQLSIEKISSCADQIHAIARNHLNDSNPRSLIEYFQLLQ